MALNSVGGEVLCILAIILPLEYIPRPYNYFYIEWESHQIFKVFLNKVSMNVFFLFITSFEDGLLRMLYIILSDLHWEIQLI